MMTLIKSHLVQNYFVFAEWNVGDKHRLIHKCKNKYHKRRWHISLIVAFITLAISWQLMMKIVSPVHYLIYFLLFCVFCFHNFPFHQIYHFKTEPDSADENFWQDTLPIFAEWGLSLFTYLKELLPLCRWLKSIFTLVFLFKNFCCEKAVVLAEVEMMVWKVVDSKLIFLVCNKPLKALISVHLILKCPCSQHLQSKCLQETYITFPQKVFQ